MKRWFLGAVLIACSSSVLAATVVLKDGRRLEAAAMEQRGSYLLIRYDSGRVESYPLAVVDLEATRSANAQPTAPAVSPEPVGPRSPFHQAMATAGEATVSLKDEDLPRRHKVDSWESPDGDEQEEGARPAGARVEMVNYEFSRTDDGAAWDVAVTVANRGSAAAAGIAASVTLLSEDGANLGSGSGRMDGTLAGGDTGRVIARVTSPEAPAQASVSLQWQEIRVESATTESVERRPAPTPSVPSPGAGAATAQAPGAASPMAVPMNPTALPNPVAQPRSPQTTPPQPPPAR